MKNIGLVIKKRRRLFGITLDDLSKMTGLSIGYLSKLERSESAPPFSTLQTLARNLNITLSELIEDETAQGEESKHDISIIRSPQQNAISQTGENYMLFPLTTLYRNRNMSPFMLYIFPGKTEQFSHDAEEYNFVVKGPITLEYDNNFYPLNDGDSFYFDSRKNHRFINENDHSAMVLSVVYLYRKF